jgi:hypothetical protein
MNSMLDFSDTNTMHSTTLLGQGVDIYNHTYQITIVHCRVIPSQSPNMCTRTLRASMHIHDLCLGDDEAYLTLQES